MRIEFITAESPLTRELRDGEFIRFPQLTVPLLAALTPPDIQVHHTDEIISAVDYRAPGRSRRHHVQHACRAARL